MRSAPHLRERGADKSYAAARVPRTIQEADGVEPIALEITNHTQIEAAIKGASDVQIVINGADIVTPQPLGVGDLSMVRKELWTNVLLAVLYPLGWPGGVRTGAWFG
ncbi:hypothetical protein [Streptomyces sp. NPDC017202]|uniref:hypothetical protein n=1 Tax=Streptomyces sp. NPDC017202 TaxID=3364981 RepID=UPI00379FD0BC